MPSGIGMAAFASGLGTGALTASQLDKNKVETDAAKLKLQRSRAEQPVIDKELEVRGAQADYNLTETEFKRSMQDFENETKKVQSGAARTQAQIAAGAATGEQQRQPGELAVKHEEMTNNLLTSTLRQTANIYRIAKLGNMDAAVQMYNDSGLVDPGQKAKSMKFDEIDAPAADGTTKKVKVLSIEGEDGKIRHVPADKLEALDQQFGATYQKAGNNIVRINRDGTDDAGVRGDGSRRQRRDRRSLLQEGPEGRARWRTPAAAGGVNRDPAARKRRGSMSASPRAASSSTSISASRVHQARRGGAAGLQRSGGAHGRAYARRHGSGEGGESGRAGTEGRPPQSRRHAEGRSSSGARRSGWGPAPVAGYAGPTPWKK
jgi:hypothetical protein